MKSPSLEPAAAPIPRGGAFGRVRVAHGAPGPRRVVGAGLAATAGRLKVLVAALPRPLDRLMRAPEGAVALAREADEAQGCVASAEISSPPAPAVPGSTVRARFVLKERCAFGQSFKLVGDVPALGHWEPANAVALDWSEGHNWTVEKDLPANRSIELKFLLRESSGKFHWQKGPNRILQTGETTKTLVVYEDWGSAKNQKVAEEDTPVEMMDTVVAEDDQGRNGGVSANELQLGDNQEIKESAVAKPIPRGGAFGPGRVAYGMRGPQRVVGAGLAGTAGRLSVLVSALPKPLEQQMPAQEGGVELAPEADAVQGEVASAEIPSPLVPGSTVRVRFVLREQCTFGHSFHLVGDDPALGLWELSNAVALDWSEGHDWTVQKDLPANRLIEFKFLLQDSLGKFRWQNGPNRSLWTGETTKTMVVFEDWGNVKNQKVGEEEDTPVEMMEAGVANDDQGGNDVVSVNELQVGDNQEIKEDESSIGNDENSMDAAIVSVVQEIVKACDADQPELLMDEQEETRDELHDEVDTAPQNGSATAYAGNVYDETTDDDSISSDDGVPVKHGLAGAFEREVLWGWKALQRLVSFKMDT
ncbi:Glucoamylase [Hordeum vulgare]|nr:Glucoamylase [Hordeum vulgare]